MPAVGADQSYSAVSIALCILQAEATSGRTEIYAGLDASARTKRCSSHPRKPPCRCVGVLLALMRQLPAFYEAQRHGTWNSVTSDVIRTGTSALGPLDDLEVRCSRFRF
jgi:hypothetical protein